MVRRHGWTLLPLLLLCGNGPEFDERGLDRASSLSRKDRAQICRPGDRFLPSLEHFVKLFTDVWRREAVCAHESVEEVLAKTMNVGATYILRDGVQDVQGRQFALRRNLSTGQVMVCLGHRQYARWSCMG